MVHSKGLYMAENQSSLPARPVADDQEPHSIIEKVGDCCPEQQEKPLLNYKKLYLTQKLATLMNMFNACSESQYGPQFRERCRVVPLPRNWDPQTCSVCLHQPRYSWATKSGWREMAPTRMFKCATIFGLCDLWLKSAGYNAQDLWSHSHSLNLCIM